MPTARPDWPFLRGDIMATAKQQFLFIGGSHDGEWIGLEVLPLYEGYDSMPPSRVTLTEKQTNPHRIYVSIEAIKRESYIRQELRGKGPYFVFVIEHNPEDLIEILLKGYKS
jgi:hypothetical protein